MPDILLTADAPGLFALFGQPQWGIFSAQSGAPMLQADSVFSVEYSRDYHISDYPQENGAFASYNKVQVPFQAKVSFLANQLRFNFLATAEAACASLGLVTVVMPEFAYPNANIVHYEFRRTARNGKTLILFDVWCEEVRILPSATSTTTPASAGTTNQNAIGAAGTAAGGAAADQVTSGPQSTNGAVPTQSGQVQPQPTEPTAQGGLTPSNNFETVEGFGGSTPSPDAISYSTVPNSDPVASGAFVPTGQTVIVPAQVIGTQSSVSTGSTAPAANFEDIGKAP